MSTSRGINAHRRNARKSTAPATRTGKPRSWTNAPMRGLGVWTLILSSEEDAAYKVRLGAWSEDDPPRDPPKTALLDQVLRLSSRLELTDRVCPRTSVLRTIGLRMAARRRADAIVRPRKSAEVHATSQPAEIDYKKIRNEPNAMSAPAAAGSPPLGVAMVSDGKTGAPNVSPNVDPSPFGSGIYEKIRNEPNAAGMPADSTRETADRDAGHMDGSGLPPRRTSTGHPPPESLIDLFPSSVDGARIGGDSRVGTETVTRGHP